MCVRLSVSLCRYGLLLAGRSMRSMRSMLSMLSVSTLTHLCDPMHAAQR